MTLRAFARRIFADSRRRPLVLVVTLLNLTLARKPTRQRAPGLGTDAEGVSQEELPDIAGQTTAAAMPTTGVAVDDEAAASLERGVRGGTRVREIDAHPVL